jgi:hypothetical protein
MKMCKYCGKIVKTCFGKRGVYCSKQCLDAVEGFDKRLATERKDGKFSLNALVSHGGDISDGGQGAAAVRSGTEANITAIMETARDIHPLLPSALMLLADGRKQAQVAGWVGIDTGLLSRQLKRLRKTLSESE